MQRWLGRGNGAGSDAAANVSSRVLAALASLPEPAVGPDEPGSWVDAVGSAAARRAFVARVVALVAGRPGRALLLNLLGGTDDAAALLDPDPLAVLVEATLPRTPLEVGGKKDQPPSGPRAPAAGSATALRSAVTALTVLGVALLALALLVTALLVLVI